MREGILYIISGPSGAGKGTVRDRVMERDLGLSFSTSFTTREPRLGEINGVHYYFVSKEDFEKMIEADEFIEYVFKFKSYYGTQRSQVEKLLAQGQDVILEIETIGAANVRKMFPSAVMIFITPSSFEELEKRLVFRDTETDKAKTLRLNVAKKEYKSMKKYDYIAINDNLDECVNLVHSIIISERTRISRQQNFVSKFSDIK